jgi:hypothetical protein
MFSEPGRPQAATPATAWDHARDSDGRQQRAAAMEAACRLMAMHDWRRDALLKMADEWAAHIQ